MPTARLPPRNEAVVPQERGGSEFGPDPSPSSDRAGEVACQVLCESGAWRNACRVRCVVLRCVACCVPATPGPSPRACFDGTPRQRLSGQPCRPPLQACFLRKTGLTARFPVGCSGGLKASRMSGVNEIRAGFLDYFARNGHEAGGVVAAGAAQRPDPDVHQCRHGAVQERLHRPRKASLCARRHRRRNACAPAASTTTSTMSATPRATTRFSRCSAISPSAIISRNARSSSPGIW